MPLFTPAHPGDLLRENLAGLREVTQQKLPLAEVAHGLGIPRSTLAALLHQRQRVTAELALRLAAGFRNTSAEFWLRVQQDYDLAQARPRVSTQSVRVFWDPVPNP